MSSGAAVFNDLGGKQLFEVLLFEVFKARAPLSLEDVRKYCISRALGTAAQIDPTLRFLEWLDVLKRSNGQIAPADQFGVLVSSPGAEWFGVRLAHLLLTRLRQVNEFSAVFAEGSVAQDRETSTIYLLSARVPHKALGVIVLLRNLGLLDDEVTGSGLLRVDDRIASLLGEAVLSAQYDPSSKPRMSLGQLHRLLAAQAQQGERAEAFVVRYERMRLADHKRVELVRAISSEDVGAGFDIISFETTSSLAFDRFIEVKSYSTQIRFYWSRTEYEAARRLGKSYYIYLVEIERIDEPNYEPTILSNPRTLLDDASSGWAMTPDTWLVTRD